MYSFYKMKSFYINNNNVILLSSEIVIMANYVLQQSYNTNHYLLALQIRKNNLSSYKQLQHACSLNHYRLLYSNLLTVYPIQSNQSKIF